MTFQPPAIVQTARAAYPKTELYWPRVSGGPSGRADRIINDTIEAHVRRLAASQGSLDSPNAEMLGYYEVKTNEKDVLSLSLFNYAYTGGAHGMTLQQSLTMKQSTGQLYELGQLFKPGSPYVKRISDLVAKGIRQRDIQTLEPFKSISPDQSFYVADRSLVVYFQLYELAPYVYGFIYFPISVYELQDIIDEEGPLGPMLAGN